MSGYNAAPNDTIESIDQQCPHCHWPMYTPLITATKHSVSTNLTICIYNVSLDHLRLRHCLFSVAFQNSFMIFFLLRGIFGIFAFIAAFVLQYFNMHWIKV